jgi:hypothetical protein
MLSAAVNAIEAGVFRFLGSVIIPFESRLRLGQESQ